MFLEAFAWDMSMRMRSDTNMASVSQENCVRSSYDIFQYWLSTFGLISSIRST